MSELITDTVIESLSNLTKEQCVEAIDNAIHRLNFERRLVLLTERQIEHMTCVLSHDARMRLEQLEGTPAFDKKIEEYARSFYFRECAWISYLNEGGEPPFPAALEGECPKCVERAKSEQEAWDLKNKLTARINAARAALEGE